MISIGNDIVSLHHINKQRTCQRRFNSKFITDSELKLYSRPDAAQMPFEVFVWLLWSAKESVYKFIKRHQPQLVFSPIKFTCREIDLSGFSPAASYQLCDHNGFNHVPAIAMKVAFQNEQISVRSVISPDYIVSFAALKESFSQMHWAVERINAADPESQSDAVRALTLKKLKQLNVSVDAFIGKSPAGYPFVKDPDVLLSFAHHGQYVSYAIMTGHS